MRNLMPGLAPAALRRLARDDRGAIGMLVALLFAGGVLLGLSAMVIDVGQLYQERAELQNGADAAAFAVAKSCATGACTSSLAAQYANENASSLTGGKAAAAPSQVCGTQAPLTACPVSTGALTDCPGVPAAGQSGYVDVRTSTQLASGSTVLPSVFGQALLGNSSYSGTKVLACAQAAWGGVPSNVLSTAFTISACEYDAATASGTANFAQPPPYPPNTSPPVSYDQQLKLRTSAGTTCGTEPAGSDSSLKFGWVTETGGCTLQIAGATYSFYNSTSSLNCSTPLFDDAQNRSLIYVPVYTKITGSGASTVYTLKGIAGFVVTGYNISGTTFTHYTDWLNAAKNCTGSTWCINGYFVKTLLPLSGTFGPANLGLSMTKLTG